MLFVTGFEAHHSNKFSVHKQLAKVLLRPIRWTQWNRTKTILDYNSLCKVSLGVAGISPWVELISD